MVIILLLLGFIGHAFLGYHSLDKQAEFLCEARGYSKYKRFAFRALCLDPEGERPLLELEIK